MSERVPAFASATDRETLVRLFDAAGYHELRLCELLGPNAASPPLPDAAVLRRRTASDPVAGLLVRLLGAGDTVPRTELSVAFGESGVHLLERVGLVESVVSSSESGPSVLATVRLVPAGNRWIASDRRDRHFTGASDFVPGPSPVSRHLAALLIPRPVESALDLGCGSGVLTLGLSEHTRRVVAADLNPRAVAMTRFSAALNGVDRIETRTGDLFETVRGERFELIVCNPPFVLSPRPTYMYRDGGASLSRRIVREAPDHLADGGTLQMLCNWPQRAGQDWRAELDRWLEDSPCDAWVLRESSLDTLSYASVWLGQQYPEGIPGTVLDDWMDYFAREGIASVGGGLIVLRSVAGRTPWHEFRDMPPLAHPVGEAIARTCEARDRALRMTTDDELLAARWRPSPDLEYRAAQRPDGNGWTVAESRLTLRAGLQFAMQADPIAAEIVGRLDGRRSLHEAVLAFASNHNVSADDFLPNLPAAFRALIWLGLVLPADS